MKKKWIVLAPFLASSAFGWGLSDWTKLGFCVSYPASCKVVYAEEQAEILEDAMNALGFNLGVVEKRACGNIGDRLLETPATELFIPDYFPPDENASKVLVDALISVVTGTPGPYTQVFDLCLAEGQADLFHACEEHDMCREDRTLFSGNECDRNLLRGWESECRSTYAEYSPCRAACLAVVGGSWRIMVANIKDFMATSKRTVTAAIINPVLLP